MCYSEFLIHEHYVMEKTVQRLRPVQITLLPEDPRTEHGKVRSQATFRDARLQSWVQNNTVENVFLPTAHLDLLGRLV